MSEIDQNAGEWVALCGVDTVEEGNQKGFVIDGKRLCAVKANGAFHVIDDQCTHGVAYLSDGYCDTEDGVVECPLHGGLFCYRTGTAKGAPAERSVRPYPARIDGSTVMVRLT